MTEDSDDAVLLSMAMAPASKVGIWHGTLKTSASSRLRRSKFHADDEKAIASSYTAGSAIRCFRRRGKGNLVSWG